VVHLKSGYLVSFNIFIWDSGDGIDDIFIKFADSSYLMVLKGIKIYEV